MQEVLIMQDREESRDYEGRRRQGGTRERGEYRPSNDYDEESEYSRREDFERYGRGYDQESRYQPGIERREGMGRWEADYARGTMERRGGREEGQLGRPGGSFDRGSYRQGERGDGGRIRGTDYERMGGRFGREGRYEEGRGGYARGGRSERDYGTSDREGFGFDTGEWQRDYEQPTGRGRDMGYRGEAGPYTGRGPKGYQRSDDRIREDVCERLANHGWIDASDMDIEVKDGEVTLKGSVNERNQKRMAEDAIEDVPGVTEIHNEVRVNRTAASGEHRDPFKPETGD
jgi:hypothetical protein